MDGENDARRDHAVRSIGDCAASYMEILEDDEVLAALDGLHRAAITFVRLCMDRGLAPIRAVGLATENVVSCGVVTADPFDTRWTEGL